MELSDRKKKILRAIVELYIRTAEPVASKTVAQMPDMDFSSATIRNEMAELTTLGYLEQPHTSAGEHVENITHVEAAKAALSEAAVARTAAAGSLREGIVTA